MTEKDKQLLARSDMLKLANTSKQLNNLYQKYEEIYTSLYGTGIDYSKERVQTTPVNAMENVICERLCDLDEQIDKLINLKKYYLSLIYKLENDAECDVLIDKYAHLKSFKRIAQEYKKPKTTIFNLEKRALTSYFNTIYSKKE